MKRVTIFWVLLFILGTALRATHLTHPIDTESWREADMATIAKNIYLNNSNMFHPQIAWDGKGPGYTESEFQVYTGLIALAYKIFGFWEPFARIISFLFSLATLLVFFKLSNYLFHKKTAFAVSFFFAFSPLLMLISNTIQPESVMFFFYISAAFTFIRWVNADSRKNYLLALFFSAMAILCKLTSAHIGIFFVLLIITHKGWRYLFNKKVILFGILSVLPGAIWYMHTHQFYLQYGNSLGISNEYALIGADFFTNHYFIKGLFTNELFNIWTLPGFIILFFGAFATPMRKVPGAKIALWWYASVALFYLLAVRTTADDWAFYYHIFSVPAVSILLGISVMSIYDKYIVESNARIVTLKNISQNIKNWGAFAVLTLIICFFVFSACLYLYKDKRENYFTSPYYSCVPQLSHKINKRSLILCSGGPRLDFTGYPIAYNKSYFFYWLQVKGYNIPDEDQSLDEILKYKKEGVDYFVAEERSLNLKPGLKQMLDKQFNNLMECNGVILYELSQNKIAQLGK